MFESNFVEEFGVLDNLGGKKNQEQEVLEQPVQIKENKRSKVFKDERERIIDDYHSALLAAAREAEKPKNFDERKLFFNLISNRLEFRKSSWDLFLDYGFFVYVGELDLEKSDINSLCSNLVLDSLFENYSDRDRLSLFPELVDVNDVFGTIVFLDKLDFVYRGRAGGYKYLPNISEKLHAVCSDKLKEFVSTGNFFREIPDLIIQKDFILPGWTSSLLIQALKQGRGVVSNLELLQLGVRIGYMVSRDETISSEILSEVDSLATEFVEEEIFYDKSRTGMLRGSGYQWIFSGLPISFSQIKDSFPKLKSVCSKHNVDVIGEKEVF
jgi:hypothetical protein